MDPFAAREADYGMTDMAMRGQQARYAADDKLMVSFSIIAMKNDEKSAKEGRPIHDDVEHIRIMVPGNKDSIVIRPVTDMDKARFAKQYENWKAKGDVPLEGTILEMWPWISKGQIEDMRFFNIRTVEQLAEIADVHAQKFMGINKLRKQARVWLAEAKKGAEASKIAQELEDRDNRIAAQDQAIEEMKTTIAALKMQVEQNVGVAPAPQPPKPKRGKAAAEA